MAKKHLIEFSPLYAAWPSYPIFLAESLSTRKFRDEAIERNANSWFLLVLELELIIGLSHALESIDSLSLSSDQSLSVVSRLSRLYIELYLEILLAMGKILRWYPDTC